MTFTAWLSARRWLVGGIAISMVAYLALRQLLTALSARHGFGSPGGLGAPYLAVAAMLFALRVVLLAAMPAMVAYRCVAWVADRVPVGRGSRRAPARSELTEAPDR